MSRPSRREGQRIRARRRTASYGSLAKAAASSTVSAAEVHLKSPGGVRRHRTPAEPHRRAGRRYRQEGFHHGPRVPDAMPTMVRRPPTVNGTVVAVANAPPSGRCRVSPTSRLSPAGVAVRAATFGQCIDAVVPWTSPGVRRSDGGRRGRPLGSCRPRSNHCRTPAIHKDG